MLLYVQYIILIPSPLISPQIKCAPASGTSTTVFTCGYTVKTSFDITHLRKRLKKTCSQSESFKISLLNS